MKSAKENKPIPDVASDLTVEVASSSFALHKFPLVSRSGRIRKLLLEAKDGKSSRISILSIPGGVEAFEFAVKFCYGVHFEITTANVAMVICVAHFLEMTDDFAEKNMEARGEAYLKELVFPSIGKSIAVLQRCESLLPVSEETNLVNRLVIAIANNACKEQLASGLLKLDNNYPVKRTPNLDPETLSDWWGTALSILNLEFFHRVVTAAKAKGIKQDAIIKILINYAHHSFQWSSARESHMAKGNPSDPEVLKKQRLIVETIISLLPTPSKTSSVPVSFLSNMLKHALMSSVSAPCKSDLERRIGLQLDQAILEDILIPLNSQGNNHPRYDTESILRIFCIFLNLDENEDDDTNNTLLGGCEEDNDFDNLESPKHSSILKASKLMDSYLAEVALDPNLIPAKFTSLAELLPDHARLVSDAFYRAIDIFLKVHPSIKDAERYKLCKTIDCQKLSQEACSHAAQNERLPVQISVQVLYFEQLRLRNAMNSGNNQIFFNSSNPQFPTRSGSGAGSGVISPRDNYASVRRENRELKLEVAKMRMRLTDLEKDHVSIKQELVKTHPANKLLRSFTRKLRQLHTLFHINRVGSRGTKTNSDFLFVFHRRQRNSVS